jgi:hypothetical protein
VARETFLPADVSWVDHAGLGPGTMLVLSGANPPVASAHLFWNTSLDDLALLEKAQRIDSFESAHATIAADGTVEIRGAPMTGPILVEEYGAAAQLEHARLITRTMGTSLWQPATRVRLAIFNEGRYLDGWLSYRSRIRTWPADQGGSATMRFTLSLPADAPAQKIHIQGAGVDRSVVVPAGGKKVVTIDVDRSRRTELNVSCKQALQIGGNRIVCAESTVPEFSSPISVSR